MVEWVKYLLSSIRTSVQISGTHVKIWVLQHTPIIPVLEGRDGDYRG